MANVLVERRSLERVAEAIRAKLHSQELITPEDMAGEILKIPACNDEVK